MGTKFFAAVLFASALPLCAIAAAAAPEGSAQATLTELRKAMLSRPVSSISSIHVAGTTLVLGIQATAEEWDDAKGLRFSSRQSGGPITGGSGWDGSSAWNEDYAGLVTIDGGVAGRTQSVDQAYFDNLAFLRADFGGAAVHWLGKKPEGGVTYDVVAVTPAHGSEMDFWVNPRTHLLDRMTSTVGLVSTDTRLSGYRKVDGVNYPFKNATKTSDGNEFSQTLSSVKFNEDVASKMGVPASTVKDFSVAGGSTTVPIDIINNHIYVHLMLNGKGPYNFILDTGGDSIVTPDVAAALNVQTSGNTQIGGVGSKTEAAGFTKVDSIEIGAATIHNQYMLVLPIGTGFGIAEGVKIDGMIGYQTVARFLTTIDYANAKVTFAMPSSRPATVAGATAVNFFFDRTIPRVPITIDGISTNGEVDTGSRAALTLSSPFVSAHPTIAAQAKTSDGVAGFGVGGPSYAKLGRVNSLQIGPFDLNGTIADFTTGEKGAFADPNNPANLGGAIWRRFTVTFDYAHHQMLLAKNGSYDSPFGYDRSGLFLIDNKGAYTVIDARPGTPAAIDHLAKGDVIETINGKPASDQSLAQVRTLFQQPAGTVYHLHVKGPAGDRDVTLTLADYV